MRSRRDSDLTSPPFGGDVVVDDPVGGGVMGHEGWGGGIAWREAGAPEGKSVPKVGNEGSSSSLVLS